jgi:hypothetical protein
MTCKVSDVWGWMKLCDWKKKEKNMKRKMFGNKYSFMTKPCHADFSR